MRHSSKTLQIQIITEDLNSDLETVNFNSSANVLELLNAAKIDISQSCGGMGTCLTCRFNILENAAAFTDRSPIECEYTQDREFAVNERLACQTSINESAKILIKK